MNIKLADLKQGKWREVKTHEVKELKEKIDGKG